MNAIALLDELLSPIIRADGLRTTPSLYGTCPAAVSVYHAGGNVDRFTAPAFGRVFSHGPNTAERIRDELAFEPRQLESSTFSAIRSHSSDG